MLPALEPPATRRSREAWIVAGVLCVVVGLHALVYVPYLPNESGRIGHDYAYYFPQMLAGAYWFHENGPFSIPWFTPAFAGGIPYYAHPSNGYLSFPQAAAIAAGPVFAVRATLVLFAALGFLGTYLLARRTFALSQAAALCAATIFAWNGFFTARMLSGHLFFHAQMLVPLAAWFVTRRVDPARRARGWWLDAALAGLVLAYLLQAGNFYGFVPAVLSCVAVALVAAWRGASLADAGVRLGGALAFAVVLSAAKLNAGFAFLETCPREGYPLPGAFNPLVAIAVAGLSVFLFPSVDAGRYALVNERWRLDQHEWDYVVTWVALALLLCAAWRLRGEVRARITGRRSVALLSLLGGVLLIPIAVNVYSPAWNAFLKGLPVIHNSSSLVRWFVAYVLPVTVLAALAVDRLAAGERARRLLAACAVVLVIATHALRDRSFYASQPYAVAAIESAFDALRATGRVPPIERCTLPFGPDGKPPRGSDRNDGLVDGSSPIACFEPIFGYEMEWFPVRSLHAGPALGLADGIHDFKNPSSYLFPTENDVEPGGHFRAGEERELAAFLAYRPFRFERSPRQRTAEALNLAVLGGVFLLLAFRAVHAVRARRR